MGFGMSQLGGTFKITRENKDKALRALKKAGKADGICGATTEDIQAAGDLEQLLTLVEWEPQVDDHGNIVDLWFTGDKALEDIKLMDALAPYVEPASFIRMIGEDGTVWQWEFDGGRCGEVNLDQAKRWEPVEGDRGLSAAG